MKKAHEHWAGMPPATACAIAGFALLSTGLLANTIHSRATRDTFRPVSPAKVTDSLRQGVAWIWPDSNRSWSVPGQAAPYREAAVLVESLVLRAEGVERDGRTQPLAIPVGVRLVPVVHVEAAADAPNVLTSVQRDGDQDRRWSWMLVQ